MSEQHILIDRADFDAYRTLLAGHQAGEVDDNRLIGERLKLGVYAQRQDGMCMLRTKLPGGRLTVKQLTGYAGALEQYSGHDKVHITTRQDIQFHHVPLNETPALLERLARFGIATREAGGNTVRNITACSLAGVCPHEQVDVSPHLEHTARHFVRHPLTQSLPRKFKMSFSGCATDCANGLIHDLAVIAKPHNGINGFTIRVGGGLGAKPRESIVLEDFIPEADLIPVIEAVIAVHDKHSDRQRKSRNRIKFLIERFGEEGFREKYLAELARTRSAYDASQAPRGEWLEDSKTVSTPIKLRGPLEQRQKGLHVVPISVPQGDLDSSQLRGLVSLLDRLELSDIRTTQEQNLSLFDVPTDKVAALIEGVNQLGLGVPLVGDKVISCPGTATCTLGITSSHSIARLLSGGDSDLTIRINGCQNSCANSELADIGLLGKGKRHHGKLVPTYVLQLGGSGAEGGLAFNGPEIPAARVPTAVQRIEKAFAEHHQAGENFTHWSRRLGVAYFDELLADLSRVSPFELSFLQRDHGDSRVFQVDAIGVGECAGAKTDPFDKLLLDAAYERTLRDAFAAKGKWDDALEALTNRVHFGGRALLLAAGQPVEALTIAELSQQLSALTAPDAVFEPLVVLIDELAELNGAVDEVSYPQLVAKAEAWYQAAHQWGLELHRTPTASSDDAQRKAG